MKRMNILMILMVEIMLASCAGVNSRTSQEENVPTVFTSIVPQQYFVNRIAGDYVEVIAMVEPGASPATYEPKPSQMTSLSEAVLYFSIDVPFETAWLDKIAAANEDMVIIDTTVGITKRSMDVAHDHEEDSHSEEESEGAFDPHVWLSPELVKIQVENIYDALVTTFPEQEQIFSQNLNGFIAEIETLESEMDIALSGVSSEKFMVFHPSWGYFAEEFGLEMIAIEVGGTEPSAAELAALITEAEHEGIQVIFAQPEFSTEDAATIAEAIGGKVIMISSLAYDWMANMKLVTDTFVDVLQ